MTAEELLRLVLEGQDKVGDKLDAMRFAMELKQDQHADKDAREFRSVRDGLGELRDRVVRMEGIADSVDSLVETSKEQEERLAKIEENQARRAGQREGRAIVINWIHWLITTLIAALAALSAWVVKKS